MAEENCLVLLSADTPSPEILHEKMESLCLHMCMCVLMYIYERGIHQAGPSIISLLIEKHPDVWSCTHLAVDSAFWNCGEPDCMGTGPTSALALSASGLDER